jgi:hypothetical protein
MTLELSSVILALAVHLVVDSRPNKIFSSRIPLQLPLALLNLPRMTSGVFQSITIDNLTTDLEDKASYKVGQAYCKADLW